MIPNQVMPVELGHRIMVKNHKAMISHLHRATESVLGGAPGLAAGVTGGGSAAPVYPTTIAQLKSYLSDSTPRVIILNKAFDFRGTEGTKTETGCRPDFMRECIAKKSTLNFGTSNL
ncbi:unnamed protein product [Aphanomyces euteiches]